MSRILSAEKTQATIPWVMLLAILLVYLCFPTRNYFFDGIHFAHSIEAASQINTTLIHPNHLVYNLVGYVFYKLLRAPGIGLRAIAALQILNGFLGALSAYVLFLILKTTLRSLYLGYL